LESGVNIQVVLKQSHIKQDLPLYRYAPHNDVLVNVGPHIRRWSHEII